MPNTCGICKGDLVAMETCDSCGGTGITHMGAPKKIVDWTLVDLAISFHATKEEVASHAKCHTDTIDRACKEEKGCTFSEYYSAGIQGSKCSLRSTLWNMAQTDPSTAWKLGKNYLGLQDTSQINGNLKHSYVVDLEDENEAQE